jgi:catechol 2,3-dioxygenase
LELQQPTLAVADLKRSLAFYNNLLGMSTLSSSQGRATVGVGDTPLLELIEQPGAVRQPARSTGLYHVAILLPSKRDLARLIMHLLQNNYRIGGASDHLVSEAFYLDDPDGNGLELYRDRPRAEWPMRDSQIQMDTLPIDIEEFFTVLRGDNEPWAGIAAGTTVGHMHLRVANVAAATRFYHDVVGFALMVNYPGASFMAVNGYHHHLGMNEWQSRGASPPPAESVGLRTSRFRLPTQADLDALRSRLVAAGATTSDEGDLLTFSDPSGNRWEVVV